MRNSLKNVPLCCFTDRGSDVLTEMLAEGISQFESLPIKKVLLLLQSVNSGAYDNIGEVINHIKEISKSLHYINSSSDQACIINILCHFYLLCHTKHPYKRKFSSILLSPPLNTDVVVCRVVDCLDAVLNEKSYLNLSTNHVIQTLEHFGQNFHQEAISKVSLKGLKFVAYSLKIHLEELTKLPVNAVEALEKSVFDIRDDLKCATVFMQKISKIVVSESASAPESNACETVPSGIVLDLHQQCMHLVENEKLGWECWNSVGLLLPYLIQSTTYYEKDKFYEKMRKLFNSSEEDAAFPLCNRVCGSAFVGICNGCLVFLNNLILKPKKLKKSECNGNHILTNGTSHENDELFMLSPSQVIIIVNDVFESLKCINERIECVRDQIAIAKCFVQWTLTIKNFLAKSKFGDRKYLSSAISYLQSYIATGLDHPVDVIRHQSRDTLINIMNIGSDQTSGSVTFVEDVINNIALWDWHKRSVYVSLQCIQKHVSVDFLLNRQPKLQEQLVTACSNQSLAPYASQLYGQLALKHFDSAKEHTDDQFLIKQMEIWFAPVLRKLNRCDLHQSRLLLDYCITKLLKLYGKPAVAFAVFLIKEDSSLGRNDCLRTMIMFLRNSQRLGLLQKPAATSNGNNDSRKDWKESVDENTIKFALVHQNDQIRLDSISLVCESWKSTVLISEDEVELVKYALPYNVNCHCPAFRQQLLNILKKFMNRLVLNSDSSMKKKNLTDPNIKATILLYKDFKTWLINFCFNQLFDGASYPRKNSSLNLLHFIISSVLTSANDRDMLVKATSTKRVMLLTGLLKDAYEDNRKLTLDILSSASLKEYVKRTLGNSFLWDLLYSSLDTGRHSTKPDICRDAAYNLLFIARINQEKDNNIISMVKYFVSCLKDDVKVATVNLHKAVRTGSMHGCLYCLRMLVNDVNIGDKKHTLVYRKLMSDCIELCYKVASAVMPVVGSNSPEGYIPQSVDEIQLSNLQQKKYSKLLQYIRASYKTENEEDHISSQRVLVTCWRSAKESYLLLQLISSISPLHSSANGEDGVLSWQQFLGIGEHLRIQLMETVHRGTFEVAYSAFRDYCPLLWRSKHEILSNRPKQWILSTVSDMVDPVAAKNICVTRRSAGLPFVMQALLGCDKGQVARDCLRHVMASLLPLVTCDIIKGLKRDDECIRQIHVLNVLRGLMKDASLSEEMMPYLSQCLMVAITGFSCKTWTIRNSSTLLFSSLMTRIFGVKREKDLEASGKNRLSSHEFFSRMPQLKDFLLDQLKSNANGFSDVSNIEQQASLHPVLLLLSRVYVSSTNHQQSNNILASFQPLLIRCGHSPILKCRVMAATALTSVVAFDDCPKLMNHLCDSLCHNAPANQTHGTLLQLHKLVSLKRCDNEDLSLEWSRSILKVFKKICEISGLETISTICSVIRASLIELSLELILILTATAISYNGDVTKLLNQLIKSAIEDLSSTKSALQPGDTLLYESYGKLLTFSFTWAGSDKCMSVALQCNNTEVVLSFLSHIKRRLKDEGELQKLQHLGSASKLEERLLSLLAKQMDIRCSAKAFSILAIIASSTNFAKILHFTRQLMETTIMSNEKLVGAVVSCQAVCLHGCFTQDTTLFQEWLPGWLQLLGSACSVGRHDACVRIKVAHALRKISTQVLVDSSNCLGGDGIEAWQILFMLLVDEDNKVRKEACHIVFEISKSCPSLSKEVLTVDSLSLENAMECFIRLHGATQPERVIGVLNHVIRLTDDESDSLDATGSVQLFSRGATNSFIETQVLHQLVQKARVQLQSVLSS